MPEDTPLCTAVRRDGEPCRQRAVDGLYCWAHSPKYAEQRQRGAQKGGYHKAKSERLRRLMPSDVAEVFDVLRSALDEVHSGALKPQQAGAMASLAGALCKLLESGELAGRVTDLETRLVDNQRKERLT